MDLELQGKRAIVTGGSRGIGRAIAEVLAEEGAHVVIAARDIEALQATAAEIGARAAGKVIPVRCDTTQDADVRGLIERAVEELGGIDILVNNAAPVNTGGAEPLAAITAERFWSQMDVKVMGYLRCAQAVAPHMQANGWGRIVNISGMAARASGTVIGSVRNVSVAALTKNLADELGPSGINVTVVHPGLTRTERTPGQIAALAARQGVDEAEAERRMAKNSIRRMVDAREIGYVVAFLASPKSIAITGDTIAAAGGHGNAIHY